MKAEKTRFCCSTFQYFIFNDYTMSSHESHTLSSESGKDMALWTNPGFDTSDISQLMFIPHNEKLIFIIHPIILCCVSVFRSNRHGYASLYIYCDIAVYFLSFSFSDDNYWSTWHSVQCPCVLGVMEREYTKVQRPLYFNSKNKMRGRKNMDSHATKGAIY